MNAYIGIDLGGTKIGGALYNAATGHVEVTATIPTEAHAGPDAVIERIAVHARSLCDRIGLPIGQVRGLGLGVPASFDPEAGEITVIPNLPGNWYRKPVVRLLREALGIPVSLINDARAFTLAEATLGAGRGASSVVGVTLGTGIGTAIFANGQLVPNTEFGHILIRGKEAEHRASERTRIKKKLSWREWAERLNEYLQYMEALFWPDLFILGGGTSKNHEKFVPYLTLETPVMPAQLFNEAGIVGAALAPLHRDLRN
jgi:polyphosphate glucokinase